MDNSCNQTILCTNIKKSVASIYKKNFDFGAIMSKKLNSTENVPKSTTVIHEVLSQFIILYVGSWIFKC